jgi:replicative DNA helicase
LVDDIPSAANIVYYAGIVKENSVRRKLIKAAYDITTQAFSTSENNRKSLKKRKKVSCPSTQTQEADLFHPPKMLPEKQSLKSRRGIRAERLLGFQLD